MNCFYTNSRTACGCPAEPSEAKVPTGEEGVRGTKDPNVSEPKVKGVRAKAKDPNEGSTVLRPKFYREGARDDAPTKV